jgi:dynein heavy chain
MVYDGPVDSYWVENLNTSLDDSKILCLSSGERIKLNTNMKMFFETSEVT